MDETFTEHDLKGLWVQSLLEITMRFVELTQEVHFRGPHHDIARRFLNEIREFESEAVQDQKARERAAREVR